MRFSAKFLLCFVFIFVASFFITTKSFAQTIPASTSATAQYNTSSTNPDVPKNLHTYTQNVMIETMASLICQLAGVDPINPQGECLGIDPQTHKVGFVKNGGGAIGMMTGAITMLYTPPIHTSDYLNDLASNFGLVKNANAQQAGAGFNGLKPILHLWIAFRDIVYLLFVIIFVVIGIAIMLRVHIDPRTVMTVQNQIPKIIIGLLLVTFSFAIAGFLIDMMYASIYLIGNTLLNASPTTQNSKIVVDAVRSTNTFGVASSTVGFGAITTEPAKSIASFMVSLFDNGTGRSFLGLLGGGAGAAGAVVGGLTGSVVPVIGTLIGGVSGWAIGAIGGGILGAGIGPQIIGGITGLIAYIVILIAVIWALFRLWFALISAYIFFLLDVIMGPFWIFTGLIPGSPVSAELWLRDVVSNLSAFPTAIIMFVLGKIMMDAFSVPNEAFFNPPMVGIASNNASGFGPLIGLGFILLTPNVVSMTKSALKAPKFDTTPIRQALGAGAGIPQNAISRTTGIVTTGLINPMTGKRHDNTGFSWGHVISKIGGGH